jgi:hypothetical protein
LRSRRLARLRKPRRLRFAAIGATGKVRVLVDMLNGCKRPILEGAYFAMHDYVVAHADAVARFARVLQQAAVYTNAHTAGTIRCSWPTPESTRIPRRGVPLR